MAKNVNVEDMVAGMGELDEGGKIEGPPPADAAKAFDTVLAGGRPAVDQLLGMIRQVDDGEDWKARYLLHGLAQYVCGEGRGDQRALLAEAIIAKIGSDAPKPVKAALIRELRVFADKSAAAALGACLADDDLYADAAIALATIGKGAAAEFCKALPTAKGRKKATIIQNLGLLGDTEATVAIRSAAGDADRDVRLAAVAALADLADEGAVDLLIHASNAKGWERIQAAKACLVLAEKLAKAGKSSPAERIHRHLQQTRGDGEQYLRDVAASALK